VLRWLLDQDDDDDDDEGAAFGVVGYKFAIRDSCSSGDKTGVAGGCGSAVSGKGAVGVKGSVHMGVGVVGL
jgi:hypothetical protein